MPYALLKRSIPHGSWLKRGINGGSLKKKNSVNPVRTISNSVFIKRDSRMILSENSALIRIFIDSSISKIETVDIIWQKNTSQWFIGSNNCIFGMFCYDCL